MNRMGLKRRGQVFSNFRIWRMNRRVENGGKLRTAFQVLACDSYDNGDHQIERMERQTGLEARRK